MLFTGVFAARRFLNGMFVPTRYGVARTCRSFQVACETRVPLTRTLD